VKSAVLLAGLFAAGRTVVEEPVRTRDHTEIMLRQLGAQVVGGAEVCVTGPARLRATHLCIPGDFSSAAFFLTAAAILPDSRITVTQVGVNPTRTGLLEVLKRMGAAVSVENVSEGDSEPVGTVRVASPAGALKGVEVAGEIIPRLIDEIPLLGVLGLYAQGETVVRDAAQLRQKESDRIEAVASQLRKFGGEIEPLPDGFIVRGAGKARGAICHSLGDHRIAMACAIAGLAAEGETVVREVECIATSFPQFAEVLAGL